MRAEFGRSAEMCRWVAAQIPHMHGRPFPETARGIGIEDAAGNLLGAVVYHDWQPEQGTIQASGAASSARWALAHEAWRDIFAYAWNECGCHKIWCATARSNERTLKFLRGLGFHFEAILYRQFGPDEDCVISSIFKWDYRSPFNPVRMQLRQEILPPEGVTTNGQTQGPDAARSL